MTPTTEQIRFNLDIDRFAPKAGSLFTAPDTFLKEALQNSRRAKASQIDITYNKKSNELIIEDDGIGIKNFKFLLSGCQSDWDEETIENESPFGLGFISLIDAAQTVEVVSGNRYAEFTNEALERMPVDVQHLEDHYAGTTIRLTGLKHELINMDFETLAMGFPISITLNGKSLAQPYREQEGKSLPKKFGSISYENASITEKKYMVFFQGFLINSYGLNIHKHMLSYESMNIIHLNASFKDSVRMPDRDCIKEPMASKLHQEINMTIREKIVQAIIEQKNSLTETEFVLSWGKYCINHDDIIHLLNDCNYLPKSFFLECTGTLSCYENSDLRALCNMHSIESTRVYSRKQLTKKLITNDAFEVSSYEEEELNNRFVLQAYLKAHEALIIYKKLDKDHWLHSMITDSDKLELSVTFKLVDEKESSTTEEILNECTPILCQYIELDGCWGKAVDHDFAIRVNNNIYIPHNEHGSDVVLLDNNYFNEYEVFLEGEFDNDNKEFRYWLRRERMSNDPVGLFKSFIEENGVEHISDSLKNVSLNVVVNESGQIQVSEAA